MVPQGKVGQAVAVIWPCPRVRAEKTCEGGVEALGQPYLPQSPSVTLGRLWAGAGLTGNHLLFVAEFNEVVRWLIGCVFPGRGHWVLNLGRAIELAAAVIPWMR